jgi:hypothetical protein
MWTHPAGSYNTAPAKNEWPFTDYGFKKTSRMTPAEGALYLGLPNVVFLRYIGIPMPAGFDSVARTLQPFKRVIWQINISPQRKGPAQFSWTSTDEEEHTVIRDLLKRHPNFVGVILDDYFKNPGERRVAKGAAEIQALKRTFGRAELWDALYTKDLETTAKEHFDLLDGITIWTREASDLPKLESNFERVSRLLPRTRKILGCYLWDYLGEKRSIPTALMKHQCELALHWLKAGRIEGICFIASSMCDMDVEAVEWTRRWVQHVGDQRL